MITEKTIEEVKIKQEGNGIGFSKTKDVYDIKIDKDECVDIDEIEFNEKMIKLETQEGNNTELFHYSDCYTKTNIKNVKLKQEENVSGFSRATDEYEIKTEHIEYIDIDEVEFNEKMIKEETQEVSSTEMFYNLDYCTETNISDVKLKQEENNVLGFCGNDVSSQYSQEDSSVIDNGLGSKQLQNHNEEKLFKCEFCPMQFTKNTDFKKHVSSHTREKPFKCDICSKQYAAKKAMKEHRLVHSNKKLLQCKICSKQFKNKFSHNKHMLLHMEEMPFKCEFCPKQFITNAKLKMHMRTHTGEKPFRCGICLKQYTSNDSLKQHMLLHTNEKPFQCEICSKRFTFGSTLKLHVKYHTGEKPFECEFCPKQFTTKGGNYIRHMRTHTGEKPFECNICLKRYISNCSLKKHVLKHTKGKS